MRGNKEAHVSLCLPGVWWQAFRAHRNRSGFASFDVLLASAVRADTVVVAGFQGKRWELVVCPVSTRRLVMSEVEVSPPGDGRTRLRDAAVRLATAVSRGDGVENAVAEMRAAMRGSLSSGPELVVEEDLAALWDASQELPMPSLGLRADGRALLYAGKIHWVSGEPGAGKTWLALFWTLEQVREGRSVVYIDMESDPVTITARLRALGVKLEELPRVRYLRVRWEPVHLPDAVEALTDRVREHNPSLVVLDGMASTLAQLGMDENSNSDVSAFTSAVLRPIADAGPAVVVVDHLAKPSGDNKSATRYARGAGAKLADASGVAFLLTVAVAFSKKKQGLAKLVVGKDRNGAVGYQGETVAEVSFVPEDSGLTVEIRVPEAGQSDGRWIPSRLMEKFSAGLSVVGSMTAGEAKAQLGKGQWEKYGTKVATLLDHHGYIEIEKQGTAKVYKHKLLFTEADAGKVRDAEYGSDDEEQEEEQNDSPF